MRITAALLALALFSALMWAAWLGWDQEYYVVDGVAQGPYRYWQVVGCAASVAIASCAAAVYVRGRRWAVAGAAIIGFALPWARNASSDTSGLWMAGLTFLVVGGFVALFAVLSIADQLAAGFRTGKRR